MLVLSDPLSLESLVAGLSYTLFATFTRQFIIVVSNSTSWQFLVVKPIEGESPLSQNGRNGSKFSAGSAGLLLVLALVDWSRSSDPKSKNNIDKIKPVAHL